MTSLAVGAPLIALVRTAYAANLPVLIEGSHGLGKSEVMAQTAAELGICCQVIDLSLCEPVDLVGLPRFEEGKTIFAPPAMLPTTGKGLLVLEEINRAPRHVRAPCLQLLTARRLNSYHLPAGWLPIACANPADGDVQYDVDELDPALRARFICVTVRPSLAEWLAWAEQAGVHDAVLDTVRAGREEALTQGGGNPRAWYYASQFLRVWGADPADESILVAALVGLLGDRWGVVLARNYATPQQRVTASEILNNVDGVATTLEVWRRQMRVDSLRDSWNALQHELGDSFRAKQAAADRQQVRNVLKFVDYLPADLKLEAREWLAEHFLQFQAGMAAPSRRPSGRRRVR